MTFYALHEPDSSLPRHGDLIHDPHLFHDPYGLSLLVDALTTSPIVVRTVT